MNIQIDKFVFRSDLKTTKLSSFPSRSLSYTVSKLFFQKLSTLAITKFTISTRTDNTLQTSVKQFGAIKTRLAFTPDCEHDNSTITLFEDVFCQKTNRSGKLCLHRKTFQPLTGSVIECPQPASVCQVRNILLKIKQVPFSCRLVKGFTFLKRVLNQLKMVLEISIVLESIVSTERNANLLTAM